MSNDNFGNGGNFGGEGGYVRGADFPGLEGVQGTEHHETGEIIHDYHGAICAGHKGGANGLGPQNDGGRDCTDKMWCFIFTLLTAGMVFTAMEAYKKGDPFKLTRAYDPDNRGCGVKKPAGKDGKGGYDLKDYPFVYFATPYLQDGADGTPGLTHTICVHACPKTDWIESGEVLDCAANSKVPNCEFPHTTADAKAQFKALTTLALDIKKKPSATSPKFFLYDTKEVYGRLCMPTQAHELLAAVNTALPTQDIANYAGDIVDVKMVILYVSLCAVVFGFVFMIIQKYFVNWIVYIFIAFFFLGLLALTWGFFQLSRGKSVYDTEDFKKVHKSAKEALNKAKAKLSGDKAKPKTTKPAAKPAAGKKAFFEDSPYYTNEAGESFKLIDTSMFWEPMHFDLLRLDVNGDVILSHMAATKEPEKKTTTKKAKELTPKEKEELKRKHYKFAFYGMIVFFLCACCCLKCIWKQIKILIAILKAAADFITDVYSVILIPVFFYVLYVAYFIWWIGTILFVYTSGNLASEDKSGHGGYPFASFSLSKAQKIELGFFVFGGVWYFHFLMALQYFIIAFAVCKWYFSHDYNKETGESELLTDPEDDVNGNRAVGWPVTRAIKTVFRFHLGSLAFGSFILATTWMLKFIVGIFTSKFKDAQAKKEQAEQDGEDGGVIKCFLCLFKCLFCLCTCFLNCFDSCLRFLTKQAYIRIALTGECFCPAARSSYWVLFSGHVDNGEEGVIGKAGSIVAGGLAEIFNLLGTMSITLGATVVGYKLIQRPALKAKLTGVMVPTILFFIISYFIATIFMNIYSVAVEAILQCFMLQQRQIISGGEQSQDGFEHQEAQEKFAYKDAPPAIAEFFASTLDKDGDGVLDAEQGENQNSGRGNQVGDYGYGALNNGAGNGYGNGNNNQFSP